MSEGKTYFVLGNGTAWQTVASSDNILNGWHQVVATFDPVTSTAKIYVDGKLANTRTNTTLAYLPTSKVYIGNHPSSASFAAGFKGKIDEVRYWTRAIDATEVQQLYTQEAPTVTTPTLTISKSIEYVAYVASTGSLTLTTNNTWTANSNVTWLKVSSTNGNAGTNLAINYTIDANTTTTARSGLVTFTAGGLTRTFTVSQAGTPTQLPKIQIVTLPEKINSDVYSVYREAKIHHYYLVKDATTNQPIKGITLFYTLSNTANTLRNSLPSDETGLIDLNLTIGGSNPDGSADDWLASGSATVSFSKAQLKQGTTNKDLEVSTNQFLKDAFRIEIITAPLETEYGLTMEVNPEITADVSILKVAGGFTASPAIFISPTSVSNEYLCRFNMQFEPYVNGVLGLEHSFLTSAKGKSPGIELSTGIKTEISGLIRSEASYKLNINNNEDMLRFGIMTLFAHKKSLPMPFMWATILKKLQNTIKPVESTKTVLGFGANFNIGATAKLNIGLDGTQIPTWLKGFSLGGEINIDAKANVEFATEVTPKEVNRTINVTAGVNLYSDFKGSINPFDKNNVTGIATDAYFKPNIIDLSKYYSTTLSQVKDNNGNLLFGQTEHASETTKSLVNDYKVEVINQTKYSANLLKNLKPALSSSNATILKNNTLMDYWVNDANFIMSLSQNSSSTGLISQQVALNEYILQNYKPEWGTGIAQNTLRNYTNEEVKTFGLDLKIPIRKLSNWELGALEFKFTSSSRYQYPLSRINVSSSLKRPLFLVEYPMTTSNITLPPSVTDIIWSKMQSALQTKTSEIQTAYASFVTDMVDKSKNVATILTNQVRKYLSGRIAYDPNARIGNTEATDMPSIFTFTIPASPYAFNTNTDIKFSHYFPENQLKAVVTKDTFQIVSDVFFLDAMEGTTKLTKAPKGKFSINTQLSIEDLKRASLPTNSVSQLLYLPIGSSTWQTIGVGNQTIQFDGLGVFALGVRLQQDKTPPIIEVKYPSVFAKADSITVTINEGLTGIDWKATYFACNGGYIKYNRVGTTNVFKVAISDLPAVTNRTYNIQIFTEDLAQNIAFYEKALVTDLVTAIGKVEPTQYALQLYPNPAKETVIIELQSPNPQKVNITLYNLQGQKMTEVNHSMVEKSEKVPINLNQQPTGFYVIQTVFADGQTMSIKLLVDK